jgi:carboxymethylenebutenolidase
VTDPPVSSYVAVPVGAGPWPAVVVLHDLFGMTPDLRRQANWLASRGFLAAAPDLYARGRKPWCVVAVMREIGRREGRAFEDVEAVRTWLVGRPDCTGKVGVLGFCLGGGFAIGLAVDHGFDAASVNYGQIPTDLDLTRACPVVGSFGGRDRTLRVDPDRLERGLRAGGVPCDVKVYPDAGHSFLNRHAPEDLPPGVAWLLARIGTGFHGPSAEDAQARITAFFDQHLG